MTDTQHKQVAILHYDEVALKGGNRKVYEQALVHNVAVKLRERGFNCEVQNQWGRIRIVAAQGHLWDETRDDELRTVLATTPGVAVFGIAIACAPHKEIIFDTVAHVAQSIKKQWQTFRVDTRRIDKTFDTPSLDMNKQSGARVLALFPDARVRLKCSDVTLRVEILHDRAYVYRFENGLSGLPSGMSGKAVALLSGGFDSPVATHMCAVRGVRPLVVHFHSYPHTSRAAIEKVEDLAQVLRDVSGPLTLFLVPLLDAQKSIAMVAPESLRVVLYRRLMMRVAERIAHRHGAKAIITGESVGQVASQTLENIRAVADATTLPILRPLAGMNKREIIDRSRIIGTHDISIRPHDDTCTVFMPKHPELRATCDQVHAAEELYDSEKLIQEMLHNMEIQKM